MRFIDGLFNGNVIGITHDCIEVIFLRHFSNGQAADYGMIIILRKILYNIFNIVMVVNLTNFKLFIGHVLVMAQGATKLREANGGNFLRFAVGFL
ncbi:Uncharacterised protein [Klebsiella pneumoniae]|nr:Uncharacterised protein [Klebsiella pneumoniae]